MYLNLGESIVNRTENYQKMFEASNSKSEEQQITEATMRGEVYGTSEFHHKISQLISRTTKLTSHGGDRKSEDYKNLAGRPLEHPLNIESIEVSDENSTLSVQIEAIEVSTLKSRANHNLLFLSD